MLRALLADRFKLTFHRDSKELPVYFLSVAKNGPKLEKAADRDCTEAPSAPRQCHGLSGGPASGMVGKMLSMSDLADNLSDWVGRLVVDRRFKSYSRPQRLSRLHRALHTGVDRIKRR